MNQVKNRAAFVAFLTADAITVATTSEAETCATTTMSGGKLKIGAANRETTLFSVQTEPGMTIPDFTTTCKAKGLVRRLKKLEDTSGGELASAAISFKRTGREVHLWIGKIQINLGKTAKVERVIVTIDAKTGKTLSFQNKSSLSTTAAIEVTKRAAKTLGATSTSSKKQAARPKKAKGNGQFASHAHFSTPKAPAAQATA